MAKKITLEMTSREFSALIDIADTISAMLGVGSDFDDEGKRNIKAIDRMLAKNGYKRKNN